MKDQGRTERPRLVVGDYEAEYMGCVVVGHHIMKFVVRMIDDSSKPKTECFYNGYTGQVTVTNSLSLYPETFKAAPNLPRPAAQLVACQYAGRFMDKIIMEREHHGKRN